MKRRPKPWRAKRPRLAFWPAGMVLTREARTLDGHLVRIEDWFGIWPDGTPVR